MTRYIDYFPIHGPKVLALSRNTKGEELATRTLYMLKS